MMVKVGKVLLAVVFIVILLGGTVAYNQWAYKDWTCMFKSCVQNTENKL